MPLLIATTQKERAEFELGALKAKSKKPTRKDKLKVGEPLAEAALRTDRGGMVFCIFVEAQTLGIELAFANACVFGEAKPCFLQVDDISFDAPVDAGDLLVFSSRVLCTKLEGGHLVNCCDNLNKEDEDDAKPHMSKNMPLVAIEVEAWVTEPEKANARACNHFYFTVAPPEGTPCRKVLPGNIDEARRQATRMAANKEHASLRS